MQYELAVRMLHRARQIANQAYPIRDRWRAQFSIRKQRRTAHQFQHDKRLIVGHACIQQSRNVRMIESREYCAFTCKPRGEFVGWQIAAQQFDGGGALVHAVAAHRAPHLSHTALTDFFGECPAAEFEARVVGCVQQRLGCDCIVQQ